MARKNPASKPLVAYNPKPSTARRKGYVIDGKATLYRGPVVYEDVIMSHYYNQDLPFLNTGRKPSAKRRVA